MHDLLEHVDMLLMIFGLLDPLSLENCSRVCWRWWDVSRMKLLRVDFVVGQGPNAADLLFFRPFTKTATIRRHGYMRSNAMMVQRTLIPFFELENLQEAHWDLSMLHIAAARRFFAEGKGKKLETVTKATLILGGAPKTAGAVLLEEHVSAHVEIVCKTFSSVTHLSLPQAAVTAELLAAIHAALKLEHIEFGNALSTEAVGVLAKMSSLKSLSMKAGKSLAPEAWQPGQQLWDFGIKAYIQPELGEALTNTWQQWNCRQLPPLLDSLKDNLKTFRLSDTRSLPKGQSVLTLFPEAPSRTLTSITISRCSGWNDFEVLAARVASDATLNFDAFVVVDLDVVFLKQYDESSCSGLCLGLEASDTGTLSNYFMVARAGNHCLGAVISECCAAFSATDMSFEHDPHLVHNTCGPNALTRVAAPCASHIMTHHELVSHVSHIVASNVWRGDYPSWLRERMRRAGWSQVCEH